MPKFKHGDFHGAVHLSVHPKTPIFHAISQKASQLSIWNLVYILALRIPNNFGVVTLLLQVTEVMRIKFYFHIWYIKKFDSYYFKTWYIALLQLPKDAYWFWGRDLDFLGHWGHKGQIWFLEDNFHQFWSYHLQNWYRHLSRVRPDSYWLWGGHFELWDHWCKKVRNQDRFQYHKSKATKAINLELGTDTHLKSSKMNLQWTSEISHIDFALSLWGEGNIMPSLAVLLLDVLTLVH